MSTGMIPEGKFSDPQTCSERSTKKHTHTVGVHEDTGLSPEVMEKMKDIADVVVVKRGEAYPFRDTNEVGLFVDNKAQDPLESLATWYHEETESYDRTVCTGPIIRGSIMPNGCDEYALINKNARKVFRCILDALRGSVTSSELRKAIRQYRPRP